jgi:eukaryotic-like serine/threonine-protein kinase
MTLAALRPGDPSQLGSYELIGRLGSGGQGVVYLGRGQAGERVAIKVLHGEVDEAFLFRELSMARRVAPFCTAQILETGVSGDTPFVVSEYIDGRSLSDVVDNDGPRTGGALQRLAIGTVTALAAIHQAGIVHRDFKPGNVLLGPDGPRVIDFGIARGLNMTVTAGEIRGTPAYMAPEQMSGQPAGTAADMFAWGATMLYAATGDSPFGSDTLPAVIQRVLYTEPDVSTLPDGLRDVVTACLSKEPAARPGAQDVLIRLLGHTPAAPADALREGTVLSAGDAYSRTRTAHQPAPPRPTPGTDPSPGGRRPRGPARIAVAAGAVLVVGVAAAVAFVVSRASSSPTSSSPAVVSSIPATTFSPSSSPSASVVSSPGSVIPAAMGGVWSGIGYQPTSATHPTYSIIMTLQGGGTTGSTLYRSLGCQGQLTLVPGSSGGVILLDEHITSGRCTGSGQFTVQLSGGALTFTYKPDKESAPASNGTLHK